MTVDDSVVRGSDIMFNTQFNTLYDLPFEDVELSRPRRNKYGPLYVISIQNGMQYGTSWFQSIGHECVVRR
jgi:hypothetical protein